MTKVEWKGFLCERGAIGKSVKITIPLKKQIITLCEVYVFGAGTISERHNIIPIDIYARTILQHAIVLLQADAPIHAFVIQLHMS